MNRRWKVSAPHARWNLRDKRDQPFQFRASHMHHYFPIFKLTLCNLNSIKPHRPPPKKNIESLGHHISELTNITNLKIVFYLTLNTENAGVRIKIKDKKTPFCCGSQRSAEGQDAVNQIAGGWRRHTWTANAANSAEHKAFYYIRNWMNWAVWGSRRHILMVPEHKE